MPETIKPLAPKEAVDFFRKKGYKQSFNWQDVWREEHAYSFTVAKAMRNDILQDIRSALDDAITNGVPFKEFSKNLSNVLADKGWWGRKEMIDPNTGEKKLVQLGSPHRLSTIYYTNLRSAYAAGHWQRIERSAKTRPYLRYVAILDDRTRDRHRAWHGIVLPVDHPFWSQFYPPNGWGCRCSVQQLSKRDLERRGYKITPDNQLPLDEKKRFVNKRSGEVVTLPKGIDPGFGYNVGKARMKSLIPPLSNAPINVPYAGNPAKVKLPKARALNESVLYPDGLQDKEYIDLFMKEFKGLEKGVYFDALGEPIIISDELFKTASGRLKIHKDMRYKYLGMLARTIIDPDEIWYVWEEYPKGRMTLRKKYLARWTVNDKETPGFVLFDTSEDGWKGITTFSPNKDSYILKQRSGALVYQRKKE
ncbi:MAG: hypothetical protein CMP22_07250 [Rickettsiales bacterium]|nr:hypothetical protein [Rickettsiales bacterium]